VPHSQAAMVARSADGASGVTDLIRNSPSAASSSSSSSGHHKRVVVAVLRGLVPTVVVALVVGLLLGAGTGSIVVVLSMAVIAIMIWLSIRRRRAISRALYAQSMFDWMSRTGYYEGPFDRSGLPAAANFERQHSIYNNPPQVRLVVTSEGIAFGPAGHSGTPMKVPYAELESVELFPGARKQELVVTPATANQLGIVVLRTKGGRTARFSSIPSEGIRAALASVGATITQESQVFSVVRGDPVHRSTPCILDFLPECRRKRVS
jgi:hypothetical protein